MITQLIHKDNNVVKFENVQILNFTRTQNQEIFVIDNKHISVYQGKHIGKHGGLKHKHDLEQVVPIDKAKVGNYYYWYSKPLHNYYHMVLDSIGHLTWYLDLKKQIPNLKLLLNGTPQPKYELKDYPPFVHEFLDLMEIDYEYTDENTMYMNVYYGNNLGMDHRGVRKRPDDIQYNLLKNIIQRSHKKTTAPVIDKIYLSRRAHANPLVNRSAIMGEDNTVKRGLANEDQIVKILQNAGFTEVFGENYTFPEKVVLFNQMSKYITTAGAGVTNILWTMPRKVSVGGIHTPGFPFFDPNCKRHICANKNYIKCNISVYPGDVEFIDPEKGKKNYNNPWRVKDLEIFERWANTI